MLFDLLSFVQEAFYFLSWKTSFREPPIPPDAVSAFQLNGEEFVFTLKKRR